MRMSLSSAAKQLGMMAVKTGKKVVDMGGDYIANHLMVQPMIDQMKGETADTKRQALLRRRESRANDKAMGY